MSIKLTPKDTILKFEVDVSGSTETPQPRLVIPISENGVSLVFEGSVTEGEVSVDISELLKLTNSKKFQGKLEVVIEDSIFIPWEDSIEIEVPTSVKAKTVKTPIKESKVNVTASNTEVKTTPIMEIKRKSVQDMFNEKL